VNAIADHYRARRPTSNIEDAIGVADPQKPVDERVAQNAEAALVWAAIDTLPDQQRTAMTLKLGEDLKLADIGMVMGKSEGAIKLLIHRGMIGLRERLDVATFDREDVR
jgi:RNA polymerase sigma-70 factor, ECF subfamily